MIQLSICGTALASSQLRETAPQLALIPNSGLHRAFPQLLQPSSAAPASIIESCTLQQPGSRARAGSTSIHHASRNPLWSLPGNFVGGGLFLFTALPISAAAISAIRIDRISLIMVFAALVVQRVSEMAFAMPLARTCRTCSYRRVLKIRGGSVCPPVSVAHSPEKCSRATSLQDAPWGLGRNAAPWPRRRRVDDSSSTATDEGSQALHMSTLKERLMRVTLQAAGSDVAKPLKALVSFKPPIGALFAVQLYRALRRKSILEDASNFFPKSWSRSRSLDLDAGDREYELAGGVHAVRVELYRALLSDLLVIDPAAAQAAPHLKPEEEASSDGEGGPYELVARSEARAVEQERFHIEELRRSLELSCGPDSSRATFVQGSIDQLAKLRDLHLSPATSSGSLDDINTRAATSTAPASPSANGEEEAAFTVAPTKARIAALAPAVEALVELRAADSLLRLLRDKLLLSAKILEQAQADCHARVRRTSRTSAILTRTKLSMSKAAVERERKKLAMTSALYERQLERLGEVQRLLLTRPAPLSASVLVDPDIIDQRTQTPAYAHHRRSSVNNMEGNTAHRSPSLDTQSGIAGSSGGGRTSSERTGTDARLDRAHGDIDAFWAVAARSWTHRTRLLIGEIVLEIVRSVDRGRNDETALDEGSVLDPESELGLVPVLDNVAKIREHAEVVRSWEADGSPDGWFAALSLVEALPKAQRAQRRLLPNSPILIRMQRLLRSSFALLGGVALHYTLKPRWPELVRAGKAFRSVAHGIFERRFYAPVRDIVLDLLNRRPRLTDAAALDDSQTSLERMLQEFLQESGRGGRAADRAEALSQLSRAYEAEIKRGAVRNILQGKLVRLILIQVQLLKTELLKAMGAIDDLVDANRLNVQLLASLPALLLLAVSSRLSFSLVHMLRTRGLRSMRQVHHEMTGCLLRLERCLLLFGSARSQPASTLTLPDGTQQRQQCGSERHVGAQVHGDTTDETKTFEGSAFHSASHDAKPLHSNFFWWWPTPPTLQTSQQEGGQRFIGETNALDDRGGEFPEELRPVLQGAELGEFVLHVHSYLLLLDFSNPAYPTSASDTIHRELQDLLQQGQLSVSQQSSLLVSVKNRHDALAKLLR